MARTVDAVIIGAGVIGASIGHQLALTGRKTLNIDQLPAAGYGPTSNSCGIIRVHYSTRTGVALAHEGYHCWRNWAEHLGADDERGLAEFRDCGCLVIRTGGEDHLSPVLGHLDALGIPYENWDREAIAARLPFYALERFSPPRVMSDPLFGEPSGGMVESAVYFPTAGYVGDPQLATHNLQRAAEAAGGTFLFGRTVTAVLRSGDRVHGVELDDGERIEAPVIVNVAGPYSARVNRMAGADADMTISTRPIRQEVAHIPAPRGVEFERDGLVVFDGDIGCAVRPDFGNNVLISSELPPCDPREEVDPDDYNRDLTDQALNQAYRYAQRVPTLEVSPRPGGVVGLYDVSDDWLPIYDRARPHGFYMAIGTSGNQFKNAPCAGRMMAALIEYCEAGNDHDASPLQYRLERTGRTIDTAGFSRRRKVTSESSFSVMG